jgi:uncharacterized protein YecT (DUF1311 family)
MARMLVLSLFAVVTFSPDTAYALGRECEGPKEGSTLQESCFLQSQSKELDDQLNSTYKKLLIQWKAEDFKAERNGLVASQRAWLAYRDKTCAFEQFASGGILSISAMRCATRLTGERVIYLNEFLSQIAGG